MEPAKKIVASNPLVYSHPIEVVAIQKKDYVKESSEILETGDIPTDFYLFDRQPKVSVYKHKQSLIDELLFGTLRPRGRDLFLYIMYHLPENQDYINLKLANVRKHTGISINSIVTALRDLQDLNIICPKAQSVYWVNPHYFFSGNRVEYYREVNKDLVVVKAVIRNKSKGE